MHLSLRPLSALLFAVLTIILASGSTAYAATQTWLPEYNRQTHIYVDPALANHPTDPVSFDAAFEQKLNALAQKHNLDIYVIATQQGDDLTGDSKRWAPEILHTPLWNKWTASSDFRERDVLILLWVRYNDNPSRNSIAARAGSRLHSYGVDRQRMFDQNGPVLTAIRANIPGNGPQAALLAIAENVNADVDAYLAKTAPAASDPSAASGESSGGFGLGLLVVIGVIAGTVFLFIIITAGARSSSNSSSYRSTTYGGSSTTRPRSSGGSSGTDATNVIAGGVLGGLAASGLSESAKEKAKKNKDSGSSGSSGGSDGGSGAGCSSAPASSCSSASCGGGSSCGGGGCGGGGCGGG